MVQRSRTPEFLPSFFHSFEPFNNKHTHQDLIRDSPAIVPYGYRKDGDQLATNKKEIRICRLVVQLVNDHRLSLMGTARELMDRSIKNRNGNIWWDHSMVRGIYKRWNGKL